MAALLIRFSRHARRRAKLYGIPEAAVEQLVAEAMLTTGENVILGQVPGISYPVKVVAALEGNVVTVVTSYPLKKGL